MNTESKTLAGVKLRAKKLEAHLKSQGINIKHSQVLEAIAAEDNYPSWNHYVSDLNSFVNSELAKSIDFVVRVPGSGSLNILHLHALYLAQKNSSGFVSIFSGYENYWGSNFPLIKEKIVYCEISLDELSNSESWMDKNKNLLKDIDGKILWINFKHQKNLSLSSAIYTDWLIAVNNMMGLLPCKSQVLHKMDIGFSGFNTQELFTPLSQFSNYISSENNWTFYVDGFECIPKKNHTKLEMNVYLSEFPYSSRLRSEFDKNISDGVNYYFPSFHPIEKIINVEKLETVEGWIELSLQISGIRDSKSKAYRFNQSSSILNFVEEFRGWLSTESNERRKYEMALEIVREEMPKKKLLSYGQVNALKMIEKWSNPKMYETYWNNDIHSKPVEKKEDVSKIITVLAELKLGNKVNYETILVDLDLKQIIAISG